MFSKKFNKKKHFRQMLKEVEQMIADLEFKKFKTLYTRENTRKQYDRVKEALVNVQGAGKKVSKEEKKNLEGSKQNLEAQLQELDARISGAEPTKENPEGVQGIDQQLTGFVELRELIKSYLKQYC